MGMNIQNGFYKLMESSTFLFSALAPSNLLCSFRIPYIVFAFYTEVLKCTGTLAKPDEFAIRKLLTVNFFLFLVYT